MTEEGSFLRDTARRWSANKSIKPGVYNCLMKVADRVDDEMVELPRGKDGRPIHVGDTVYGEDGRAWHVRGVTIGEKSIAHPEHVIRATSDAEQLRYLKPEWLTHERPDSWERIADELDAWCDKVDVDRDACEEPRALARRIRRLAERKDGR